jgi:hypothetical protein
MRSPVSGRKADAGETVGGTTERDGSFVPGFVQGEVAVFLLSQE